MPIYEWKCVECGEIYSGIHSHMVRQAIRICPKCGEVMKIKPSVTGYRRDHTVS